MAEIQGKMELDYGYAVLAACQEQEGIQADWNAGMGGIVEIGFGAEWQSLPVAGSTVADLRDYLKHVLNIPPHAEARVNGELVETECEGKYVTQDGDTLEFIVVEGHKETWAEEHKLARHILPWQLAEFRAKHREDEDWTKLKTGVYLYRKDAVYKDYGPPSAEEILQENRRLEDIYFGVKDRDEAPGKMAYRDLERAHRLALFSFIYAETRTPDRKLKDEEAYEILQTVDFSSDQEHLGELASYRLPAYETWTRYLRVAREKTGESKYQRRAGRSHGDSIVGPEDI